MPITDSLLKRLHSGYRACRFLIHDNKSQAISICTTPAAGILLATILVAFLPGRTVEEAVVTGVVKKIVDSTEHEGKVAVIDFVSPSGERMSTLQDAAGKSAGQNVRVAISEEHERVAGFRGWLPFLFFGLLGYGLLMLSLSRMLRDQKFRALRDRLLRDGKRASGTVVSIRRCRVFGFGAVRVGPSIWLLAVDWLDPRTREVVQFESDWLPWRPVESTVGQTIPLLIDDGPDATYWIDVRGVAYEP